MGKYVLIGSRGCGSAIIELAMLQAGAEHELEEIPYLEPGPDRDRLLELNPLGQVPTLIMPSGEILTESAAIILHLADTFPDAELAPSAADKQRPAFLRWLIFIVSEIYPTWNYSDDPARWQLPEANHKRYRKALEDHRLDLWRQVEDVADTPYFLGSDPSALDLYIAVMRHWTPGADTFRRLFPKLTDIADNIAGQDLFGNVLRRNSGE